MHSGGEQNSRQIILPDEKVPPHNLEAEMGVIGSILLDNEVIFDVAAILKPPHMYRNSHEIILRRIYEVHAKGLPIDSITLEDHFRLESPGEYERIGGFEYIFQIIEATPHAANARYYAKIVKESFDRRSLIDVGNGILKSVYWNTETAEAIQKETLASLLLTDNTSTTRLSSAAQAVEAYRIKLAERAAGTGFGRLSGLNAMDEITTGFRPGEVIVLAARPSMGKTSFALHLLQSSAFGVYNKQGEQVQPPCGVIYFTMEMPATDLVERVVSNRSRINGQVLKTGQIDMNSTEGCDLEFCLQETANAQFDIYDAGTCTIEDITMQCFRKKANGGLGLVVIDYLQLMSCIHQTKGENRQEQISKMTRAIKNLARDLDCPIVLVSQLNRDAEKREDHRPRMADLRESGAIEQDADYVILLYRNAYYDHNDRSGICEVDIAKNRNGPIAVIPLRLSINIGLWEDMDDGITEFDRTAQF